jgi:hypothetical protein
VSREDVLQRFESGEPIRSIARALGVTPAAIRYHLTTAGLRPKGDKVENHCTLTEPLLEMFDGLLLGGAHIRCSGRDRTPSFVIARRDAYRGFLDQIEAELALAGIQSTRTVVGAGRRLRTAAYAELEQVRARWYPVLKAIPADVRITPRALAYFFSAAGARVSSGYSVRFSLHAFGVGEVERLARRLKETYAWEPEVYLDNGYPLIRLSRPGDRLSLRKLIIPWVPACFAQKLNLRNPRGTTS